MLYRKLFFFYNYKNYPDQDHTQRGDLFVLLFFCTGVPGYVVYGLQQHHMDTFYSHSKNFVAFFVNCTAYMYTTCTTRSPSILIEFHINLFYAYGTMYHTTIMVNVHHLFAPVPEPARWQYAPGVSSNQAVPLDVRALFMTYFDASCTAVVCRRTASQCKH